MSKQKFYDLCNNEKKPTGKNLSISMNRELVVSCRNSRAGDSDDGESGREEIDDDFAEGGGESSGHYMNHSILLITQLVDQEDQIRRNHQDLPLLLFPLIPVN